MTTVPTTYLPVLDASVRQGPYRVAVVRWSGRDELSEAICASLRALGHEPLPFDAAGEMPAGADIVFSFAPYGNFMALVDRLAALPKSCRPFLIHWNTEGIPDMHLPWAYVYPMSRLRSWVGRATTRAGMADMAPFTWLKDRMLRYRYVGDYYSAHQRGIMGIYADSSAVYADLHRRHGLPTTYFPWGATPSWYADLNMPRDIDVLWLGKRGTRRRSSLLDRVRKELNRHGIDIYMADNVEHPFIFREERTEMMNRAKITINITRTWYDDNFSRFSMAAPNHSLIVSEPMLPHCPEYQAGVHYVTAPIDELAATILHYLSADEERRRITDRAFALVTEELTLVNSVGRVMAQAHQMLTNAAVLTARVAPREVENMAVHTNGA
jgi:hypothetical protein